ncbi:hypothetical protein VD659_18395 [Herbiconiux sp. 11R-BC]|uniref:hypothetical protein n=1 Tax=Herbiconiux sp. 11R-BC TaxID=3111637 RepID=UPI003BFC5CC0
MGFVDDAKDAAQATGRKIGEAFDDAKDRVGDKIDEVKADAEVKRAEGDVKRAEAERDATQAKNEYKEKLRD